MKVKKTKIVSILGTLGLTVGVLSGCGTNTPTSNKPNNSNTPNTEKDRDDTNGGSTYVPVNGANNSQKSGVVSGSKGLGTSKGAGGTAVS